jgi:3-dehydroquinate synthase
VGPRFVQVALEPPYRIAIGSGVLSTAIAAAGGATGIALIADARAAELHAHRIQAPSGLPRLDLPAGEAAKELAVLGRALDFLAQSGLDRSSCVLVLGGGAACDLGALAASLYMRGIAVVLCPTTLLAQVDASVGGKTAINTAWGKNLAGTFHQPRAVIADVDTLSTLDEEDYRSGLGEVAKCAVLGGEQAFRNLEESADALLARHPDALQDTVAACVALKARIVASDERESGPRKQLNLGHTFAHAIERVAGYGAIPHGIAVACGLSLAAETSRACGLLADPATIERLRALLARLGLPADLAALRRRHALEPDALLRSMRSDKKNRAARIRLVLPRTLGAVEHDVEVDDGVLLRVLA